MLQIQLTNEMLKRISSIDEKRIRLEQVYLPIDIRNKFRKNSLKKSAYASAKIEGNPLTEGEVSAVIDADPHKHFLKPEQEVRNYYRALELLAQEQKKGTPFSIKLLLKVQALVEKGASKEKIGLRQAMPPGFLFAVYDAATGKPEYIPPEYTDIPQLLDELEAYVRTTEDHPLIVAAVVHYQLVTIHPFEDGNGRTARLLSGYLLDIKGYGFAGMGSLEEYFAYDTEAYYNALQMGLPALYYSGRDNPPHPEIWVHYYLRMVELYATKVYELSVSSSGMQVLGGLSYLNAKEKALLQFLLQKNYREFAPAVVCKSFGVSSRTIINWAVNLVRHGFVSPDGATARVRKYALTPFALENCESILKEME